MRYSSEIGIKIKYKLLHGFSLYKRSSGMIPKYLTMVSVRFASRNNATIGKEQK